MLNDTVSNQTIDFKTLFLKNIRSSWTIDSLILYILVPMGILGTILNSISLIIFITKFKNTNLFIYLKVNTA